MMADIPEGVTVSVNGSEVAVKGPKGSLKRTFRSTVSIKPDGKTVIVAGEDSAYVGTVDSLICGMCKGVKDGFEKRLKVIYAHFPISVEVKGKDILIKNFQGEKEARKTCIAGEGTKVEVKGQSVTISGPDKEGVGQTFANIRAATRIKEKDSRVFQDGLYELPEGAS